MPEKTFKEKAMKYKRKYYATEAAKTQSGGDIAAVANQPIASMNTYQNMINMIGGNNIDTPDNLDELSE